jgi:hypothetical protein
VVKPPATRAGLGPFPLQLWYAKKSQKKPTPMRKTDCQKAVTTPKP